MSESKRLLSRRQSLAVLGTAGAAAAALGSGAVTQSTSSPTAAKSQPTKSRSAAGLEFTEKFALGSRIALTSSKTYFVRPYEIEFKEGANGVLQAEMGISLAPPYKPGKDVKISCDLTLLDSRDRVLATATSVVTQKDIQTQTTQFGSFIATTSRAKLCFAFKGVSQPKAKRFRVSLNAS